MGLVRGYRLHGSSVNPEQVVDSNTKSIDLCI